jgi:putative methyltransferase
VHDLLLAKRGIALPATHGLRASVERHKARLQAEFTKARIRRSLATTEALKEYVDSGVEGSSKDELPYPRWVRINTLKTQLEDQLETTFADYEQVATVNAVRQRGARRIHIDVHVPNLVAVSASADLTKSEAYTSGAIIFQDKASSFPAYMLDPLPQDGDIIDTCAAPGNKTTHLASILLSHATDPEDLQQTIHAFEKNKIRAETLKKMLSQAGSQKYTKVHSGVDFLKVDPTDPTYKNVGALLLDPSCSGSGIVGRDDMPELHLPSLKPHTPTPHLVNSRKPTPKKQKESLKRKRPDTEMPAEKEAEPLDIIDDDGVLEPMSTSDQLQTRLTALSAFQLSLLLHAMSFPSARKITYSTCSIHAIENEEVVLAALASDIARTGRWRVLRRNEQVRGMEQWPVRGDAEVFNGKDDEPVREACVRANKGDEFGTMGFFLAGFVRSDPYHVDGGDRDPPGIMRDEKGFIVRDIMGIPVIEDGEEEWGGIEDEDNDQGAEDSAFTAENHHMAEAEEAPVAAPGGIMSGSEGPGDGDKVARKRKKKGNKKSR